MSNIKVTKKGLIEKTTGRKIVSPLDINHKNKFSHTTKRGAVTDCDIVVNNTVRDYLNSFWNRIDYGYANTPVRTTAQDFWLGCSATSPVRKDAHSQKFGQHISSFRGVPRLSLLYDAVFFKVVPFIGSNLWLVIANAALSGVPKGIRLLCLVLPAAERRGGSGTHRSAPHSPRSEAEGGTARFTGGGALATPSRGSGGYAAL